MSKAPRNPQARLLHAMDSRRYESEEGRLAEIQKALEEGATPNDVQVQKAWLTAPPTWIEAPVRRLFEKTLRAQPGLPVDKGMTAGNWSKLDLLLDRGLSPNELGNALLAHEKDLPGPGLDLLAKAISQGFAPSRESVLSRIVESEDVPRALLLAEHGLLDPNLPLPRGALGKGAEGWTYAQALVLLGRSVDLPRWVALGADFSRPFPDGSNLATRVLREPGSSADPRDCPILPFRARHLLELSKMGMVDWTSPDAHGETGLQAYRALRHSSHPLWEELETQIRAQVMQVRLPVAPARPRSRL